MWSSRSAVRLPASLLSAILIVCVIEATSFDTAQIKVRDVGGRQYDLTGKDLKATVLFFVASDCPISNSYAPEINRIVSSYQGRKLSFFIVYVDQTIPVSDVKKHAKDFGFGVPLLVDHRYFLVRMAGATVTPEAAVLDRHGAILYRGRIDDLYYDYGKRRNAPTKRELRDALDAILNDRAVAHPREKAIGCFIAWEK